MFDVLELFMFIDQIRNCFKAFKTVCIPFAIKSNLGEWASIAGRS